MYLDLSVKHETIKFLEKNTGENLCDPKWHKGFLATTPKAQPIKGKKMYINETIKIQNFSSKRY